MNRHLLFIASNQFCIQHSIGQGLSLRPLLQPPACCRESVSHSRQALHSPLSIVREIKITNRQAGRPLLSRIPTNYLKVIGKKNSKIPLFYSFESNVLLNLKLDHTSLESYQSFLKMRFGGSIISVNHFAIRMIQLDQFSIILSEYSLQVIFIICPFFDRPTLHCLLAEPLQRKGKKGYPRALIMCLLAFALCSLLLPSSLDACVSQAIDAERI